MSKLKPLIFFFLMSIGELVLAASSTVSEIGMGSRFVSMLGGLFVIVVLIFVSAWLYKKMGGVTQIQGADIQVCARQSLGTREKVILLRVKGQELLVGVTPSSITTLHVFEPGDAFESVLSEQQEAESHES